MRLYPPIIEVHAAFFVYIYSLLRDIITTMHVPELIPCELIVNHYACRRENLSSISRTSHTVTSLRNLVLLLGINL